MGRVKLEIKKIPNHTNRQVTFSKRRNGLIKKAYELCVLSNIDLALIMFSPSGRLVAFSGRRRIEDVLIRYLNLPEEEILSGLACPRRDGGVVLENRAALIGILNRLKHEDESAFSLTNETIMKTDEEIVEEITQEISLLHEQLESAEEELSTFEPDPLDITSLEELESLEQKILKMLSCIIERKEYLLNNQASSSSYDPYLQVIKEKLLPFENSVFSWIPEDGHNPLSNEYVPSIPERDLPSTGFCAMLQGTSSNMDQSIMEEEVVFHPENESPSVSWKYPYASPYSNASHMETAQIFQPPLQHDEQEHIMEGMLQSQAEIYSQALQHEKEELGMGPMPSGQAETFSEQFQHEEEDQGIWSIQQGQADRFLPPLQDEDGQSKGATPQGQPEIFLSPHQQEKEQPLKWENSPQGRGARHMGNISKPQTDVFHQDLVVVPDIC